MLSVLTEKKIRDLKPKEKRYVVGDSDCLYLEIMPSGTKAWQFRQRLKTGETVRTTRKTLGHYPALSLYEARLERDRLKIARERTGNIYVQPHQGFNSDVAASTKAHEALNHVIEWVKNGGKRFDEQLPYYGKTLDE